MGRIFKAVFGVVLALVGTFVYQYWNQFVFFGRFYLSMPYKDPFAPLHLFNAAVESIPDEQKSRLVVLSVMAKMGTTWVSHIAYQLLSRGKAVNGSMPLMHELPYPEFAEGQRGVPLHELDPPFWQEDIFSKYPEGPIIVRTHVSLDHLRESGGAGGDDGYRVITVLRDIEPVCRSAYKMMIGIVGMEESELNFDDFLSLMSLFPFTENILRHFAAVWETRHDPNVLVLFFDDMIQDLSGSVRAVADQLELSPPATEEELELVTSQSSKKAMSAPEWKRRFSSMAGMEHMFPFAKESPELVASSRSKVSFSEKWKKHFDDQWMKIVFPRTNCTSYSDMRAKFHREREALQKE